METRQARPQFPAAKNSARPPLSPATRHPAATAAEPFRAPRLQLIVFAFHDSKTLRETIEEGKAMQLLVTVLFLD